MAAEHDTQMMDPRALPGAHIDLNNPAQPAHEILGLSSEDMAAPSALERLQQAATRTAQALEPSQFSKHPKGVQRIIAARFALAREAFIELKYPFKGFLERLPARILETGTTVFKGEPEQLQAFACALQALDVDAAVTTRREGTFLVANSAELFTLMRTKLPKDVMLGLQFPGTDILSEMNALEHTVKAAFPGCSGQLIQTENKGVGLTFTGDMGRLLGLQKALTHWGAEAVLDDVHGADVPTLRVRTKHLPKMVDLLRDTSLGTQLQFSMDLDLLSKVPLGQRVVSPRVGQKERYDVGPVEPSTKRHILEALGRAGIVGAEFHVSKTDQKEWLQLDPASNRAALDALAGRLQEHYMRNRESPSSSVDAGTAQRDPNVVDIAAQVVRDY